MAHVVKTSADAKNCTYTEETVTIAAYSTTATVGDIVLLVFSFSVDSCLAFSSDPEV